MKLRVSDANKPTAINKVIKANQRGFNLIEMLVVLVILAILATLLLDNHQGNSNTVEQAQAQQLLLSTMQQQQRYYTTHHRYASDLDDLSIDAQQGNFVLAIINCQQSQGDIQRCIRVTATHQNSNIIYGIDSAGQLSQGD